MQIFKRITVSKLYFLFTFHAYFEEFISTLCYKIPRIARRLNFMFKQYERNGELTNFFLP